ncbi:MAG: two-component system C4-dicarboxylate transport sensor histidine kinase DctB [Colwellia sp.]|jgi:two-component system C4-dicarboxylate transport sensor histidine kinase DctB
MTNKKIITKRYFIFLMLVFGFILTIYITQFIGVRSAYSELNKQSNSHLNHLIFYIESTLGRFEKIPDVLSKHPLLQEVLQKPNNDNRERLNLLLEEIGGVAQASDIYLMDKTGLTLASSNWQSKNTFIGMDFSFRPYFQQAIKGQSARYYAVGLSSNKRGYYFTSPVTTNGEVIGVIAVKISIDEIESQHKEAIGDIDYNFLIVAPDDVVFISDKSEWRLKTIGSIGDKKAQQLKYSTRYSGREIAMLDVQSVQSIYLPKDISGSLLKLKDKNENKLIFTQKKQMLDEGWRVHLWTSLDNIEQKKSFLTIFSASGYLLIIFLVLFAKERMRNAKNQRDSRLVLEQRVEERTADLTASNAQLIAEIEQRKQTQAQLNKTQDELIQSAKLAVIGNMSASINHEINQPLTALRSYSQNALSYQERGQEDKTKHNLELIITLVDRLADIVSQFKHFSKKSSGIATQVYLQESINAAISIVKHQAQNESVQLRVDLPENKIFILGDDIRLEQVLINLFNNAIQAMTNEKNKRLDVSVTLVETKVIIAIKDTGPGILASNLDKIFEPFFTTKERIGLGLGLSISQRIIELMQGLLVVENHNDGGAEFKIVLPLYTRST